MLATATNYGRSQGFPTCIGNFFLPYGRPVDISDPKVARELQAFPLVEVQVVRGKLGDSETVDYADYTINELRSIAKQVGISGGFFMKKSELIDKLGGTK